MYDLEPGAADDHIENNEKEGKVEGLAWWRSNNGGGGGVAGSDKDEKGLWGSKGKRA